MAATKSVEIKSEVYEAYKLTITCDWMPCGTTAKFGYVLTKDALGSQTEVEEQVEHKMSKYNTVKEALENGRKALLKLTSKHVSVLHHAYSVLEAKTAELSNSAKHFGAFNWVPLEDGDVVSKCFVNGVEVASVHQIGTNGRVYEVRGGWFGKSALKTSPNLMAAQAEWMAAICRMHDLKTK